MKRLSLIATFCTWMLSATVALATPASLFAAAPIARATFGAAITTTQTAGAQSVIQQFSIVPGGHSGWHSHPGRAVVFVQAGTISIYDAKCAKSVTEANRGFVEAPGNIHLARNETSGLLLFTVVFFDVPGGGAVRSDAVTPGCAVANNLPDAPRSGVTVGTIARSTFATPIFITAEAERDVLVQRATIAPGGHSGWHGHPGWVMVFVESGTLTFYRGNCGKETYTAGQGAVEFPHQPLLARNEGTSPVVLRAVLFDIPVAGSARHDMAEPAGCAIVSGAATVAQLPSTSVDAAASTGIDPAIFAILVALTSVIGLAVLQRSRARRRVL
jgi:quercetin dioxygenase-like cupin family protein